MVTKVGQTPLTATVPTRTPGVAVATAHDSYRHISNISASGGVGPEEQSLRFSESWDDLNSDQDSHPRRRRQNDRVRFGDIITTTEISGALVEFRARNSSITMPTMRFGALLYERSMLAVANRGVVFPVGGAVSRLI